MNLNQNSHFSYNPGTYASRSRFDLSHSVKTSFNAADLVPFYVEEVLPGDTFSLDMNVLARMQTLMAPIMDDIILDVDFFFVPNRIIWDHWKDFMGENTQSAWYPTVDYNVPQISVAPSKSVSAKTTADYMGIPPITAGSEGFTFNALPFRAYGAIWNEWYRDENLQDPVLVDTGDSTRTYDSANAVDGGALLKANKYHDYFTSALPSPQKGEDVLVPLGGLSPVYSMYEKSVYNSLMSPPDGVGVAQLRSVNNGVEKDWTSTASRSLGFTPVSTTDSAQLAAVNSSSTYNTTSDLTFNNLWADLSQTDARMTINQLRLAFATQRLYEKDARGGTRYREIIKSHFNTISPDARQQVPELLGHNSIHVNISQVVQNSETGTTPQGHTAAFSVTADGESMFTKSFTEHGLVMGLMTARWKHTYQQGLNRMFSRKTRFDYYWPVFANLGEQPILNKEIYLQGTSSDSEVFGYQEAWAEYRYHPDTCTAEMRSSYPQSLDLWHLGDDYSALPTLSPSWIQEDYKTLDRALAVTSSVSNQFFADIYIKNSATRVMPMFSIPGMQATL